MLPISREIGCKERYLHGAREFFATGSKFALVWAIQCQPESGKLGLGGKIPARLHISSTPDGRGPGLRV
jgi:hypothetical protein